MGQRAEEAQAPTAPGWQSAAGYPTKDFPRWKCHPRYLPGLDGDWQAVAGRVRFGEFTCPTLLTGAVGNYSAAARQRFSVRAAWASAKRCGESIAQR